VHSVEEAHLNRRDLVYRIPSVDILQSGYIDQDVIEDESVTPLAFYSLGSRDVRSVIASERSFMYIV
jgi:hypothetical protein